MQRSKRKNPPQRGVLAVAEMLEFMDDAMRNRIVSEIQQRDPELMERIQTALYSFDQLTMLSAEQLQCLIRSVPQTLLALSLRKCSDELKMHLFSALSERGKKILQEEVDSLGLRKVSEIEAAQRKISEVFKKMVEEGKIRINEK